MASIRFDSASIHFPIYGTSRRALKLELLRIATGGLLQTDKNKIITVQALDNITLEISNGMRVGLIGHNGAGKSTFLRTVAGIYEPTSGTVQVTGTVTPILEMMVGINEDSTGYENIMIRGLLQGLTHRDIEAKKEEIAEFTGLGDYLWMPTRTYSSGMQIRLAFGIATSIIPEILVVDEVFSAGDASFRDKAKARMENMIQAANIVIFTSHELSLIKTICSHALWLDAGRVKAFGPVDEVVAMYEESILAMTSTSSP